ncbi:1-acyl-sn-glycerol-3-phosphate acyltransferase alpha, partial [Dryobates pubescens]
LLLLLPLALLLYCCSATVQYFCKVAFFNCWIVTLATLLSPLAAFRGRSVENMKLLRAALLPLKHIYGIKMQVRGSEHLNIKEPFVMVCNHQASLDLLGMWKGWGKASTRLCRGQHGRHGRAQEGWWHRSLALRTRCGGGAEAVGDAAGSPQPPAGNEDLLEPGARQELESPPWWGGVGGSVWRTFLRPPLLQVPIFPMVISPYWDFFSSKEKRFTSGTCSIQILPRVETQGLTPKDVPQLAERVWQAMADVLAQMAA